MINILIAEDEKNIALALKTIVLKGIKNSNVLISQDGIEALSVFNTQAIDLIVSDWNMPLMSGDELLSAIRDGERNPDVPFLMLTARADSSSVRTAIDSHVTEYIVKPFNKGSLLEKVRFLLDSNNITGDAEEADDAASKISVFQSVMDLVKIRMEKGYLNFPVLSEVGIKAVEIINNENNSFEELIEVIKPDQAISSKVMSVSNSSFYRGQMPIETLESALTRIGLKEAGNIVLAYSLRELYKDNKNKFHQRLKVLWDHSLTTAVLSKNIGLRNGCSNSERIYSAALFHDIGKLLLMPVLIELQSKRDDISDEIIDNILAALHVNIGMNLLKHWEFSSFFIDVIKQHHDISDPKNIATEIKYIMLANQLSKLSVEQYQDCELEQGSIAGLCRNLGLNKSDINELMKQSMEQVVQIKSFFYS